MKILLIGTSLDHNSPMYGNLAGFSHGYGAAFASLGHDVDSISHRQADGFLGAAYYDLLLLRDVTVNPASIAQLATKSRRFAVFTHAEFIQGRIMDVKFFASLKELGRVPDHIFYDQPLAHERYAKLGIDIPGTFLGWGANPACYHQAWDEKDIDILWLGHAYGERQPRVENLIFPLKNTPYRVKIHGRHQPDKPLNLPRMFNALARAKIVVRISHKAHWEGGYSGRTIYDALASRCFVVHDRYPMCEEMFPYSVAFCDVEEITERVLEIMEYSPVDLFDLAIPGWLWVTGEHMIEHHAQRMLEILELDQ